MVFFYAEYSLSPIASRRGIRNNSLLLRVHLSFDKRPKMGTVIMKVEIFSKEGKRDTSFDVKTESSLSMRRTS
jgi:hypothetical protein